MRYLILFLLVPFLSFSQVKLKGYELTDSTQNNVVLKDDNTIKVLNGFVLNGSLTETPTPPPSGPSCSDGIQNGDETGVDCGGSCPPCIIEPVCTNGGGGTLVPTSAADFENVAYQNYTFTINNSLDISNRTFVSGLRLVPGTGVLSGSDINLNNACVEDTYTQIFDPGISFTALYANSVLSLEAFGADGTDNVADDTFMATAINQCEFIKGQPSRVYIKNFESTYNRSGRIVWDLNTSIIRTTSDSNLSHGGETFNLDKYLMTFVNFDNVQIANGEFDGQNQASRLLRLTRVVRFNIFDVYMHDYFAPPGAYARAAALKFNLYDSSFLGGNISNCRIENIRAASNGNANDTPFGVSKGFYFEYYEANNNPPAWVTMSGNVVDGIYGDDAEGMINVNGFLSGYNHQLNNIGITMSGDTYLNCDRRALKINASNTIMDNMTFRSVTNAPIFPGQQATMVQIFSILGGQPIENVSLTNSLVDRRGASENVMIGITDAQDILIQNNTIQANGNINLYNHSVFGADGTQSGLYDGDLNNVRFIDNTLTNTGLSFDTTVFDPIGSGLIIENNVSTYTVTANPTGEYGAIQFYNLKAATSNNPITIKDHTININQTISGADQWSPIKARSSTVTNLTFDNVNINLTGFPQSHAFGDFMGSFGSSNQVINCTLTGASGTGAIEVRGADASAIINNSFGDGGTPITTQ